MTDKDIIKIEAEHDGKAYAIAYSLKEQKRANDLKEVFIWTMWIFMGLVLLLYAKLDSMNVVSRVIG